MHDVEEKVVLGTAVNDGNDVLDVLLSKNKLQSTSQVKSGASLLVTDYP